MIDVKIRQNRDLEQRRCVGPRDVHVGFRAPVRMAVTWQRPPSIDDRLNTNGGGPI